LVFFFSLVEIARDLEIEQRIQEEPDEESDGEDGDKPLYNPKNVPLDYTGKPIPYWLFKLHGLNLSFKCEMYVFGVPFLSFGTCHSIRFVSLFFCHLFFSCGGFAYRGPRAFERHFKESRHAFGLKTLGIPNTNEFMNITTFEDAKTLWEKLQKENKVKEFKPEEEEEVEDHDGNVFSKRIFNDLKRQGIVS
jgi:splicing factor 3A subunit 3